MGKEIKDELLEALGFDQEALDFYKKFFDNFDCNFDYNCGQLSLNVRLNKKVDSIEGLAKILEKRGISLGEELHKMEDDLKYNVYEKGNLAIIDSNKEGQVFRYVANLESVSNDHRKILIK